jgi:hypothetical protein
MSHLPPIYYNLSQINGYKANQTTRRQIPAIIEEFNNQLILENQKDYYVSVVRASIPTSSIPRLIVPIETGITQTDKNKTLYKVRIKLCTGVNPNGTLIFNEAFTTSNNVTFVSQLPFEGDKTPPPSQNNGSQFLDNDYYYVYDVEALLKMFNDTLNTTFTQFCAQGGLPQPYNAAYAPHILWNSNNRHFELKTVADVAGLTYFDDSIFPNLVFQCDLLSSDLFQLSGSATSDAFINNYSFNKYNNETIVGNVKYYTMTATQSSLNNWGSFSKVIFSISYGISTIQEYDSVPTPDQGSTNSYNLNKPSVPMLTDIEVDKDAFSINNNFIQYQTSSITQSRLISMTGSMLQSFQLSVYWLDVFGVRHSLSLPEGLPLTIKLGFYPKTTTLI